MFFFIAVIAAGIKNAESNAIIVTTSRTSTNVIPLFEVCFITCDLIMKEASMLKPDFGCILDIRFLKVDWTNLDVKVIEDVKGVQKRLTKLGMRFVVRVVNNEFWLDNLVNREALDPETWVQLTLGEGQLDAGYKASFANNLAEAEAMLDSFKS